MIRAKKGFLGRFYFRVNVLACHTPSRVGQIEQVCSEGAGMRSQATEFKRFPAFHPMLSNELYLSREFDTLEAW